MGWFILTQLFSILIQLIRIGRMPDQEKDLEIMILRYQLDMAERKLQSPLKPTKGTIAYRSGHDAVPVKDVANGGLGDFVPYLEQFPRYLAVAPAIILLSQADNQRFKLVIERWSPAFVVLIIGPLAADQLAMPTQHGFRLKETNEVAQLVRRSLSTLLQGGHEYGQGQLLRACFLNVILRSAGSEAAAATKNPPERHLHPADLETLRFRWSLRVTCVSRF